MKSKFFHIVASALTVVAGIIITPLSFTYIYAPETPEELQ